MRWHVVPASSLLLLPRTYGSSACGTHDLSAPRRFYRHYGYPAVRLNASRMKSERCTHLTFVQAGQGVTEGRIENIWCSPTEITAPVSRAWILRELFRCGSKSRFTTLNIGSNLFQFHAGLFVSHDRRRFQQNMASMNFGHRDIFCFRRAGR